MPGEIAPPTLAEIEEACRQIRSRWSERRMRIRAGLPPESTLELEPISLLVQDGRAK